MSKRDYQTLRSLLLELETFPHHYVHKLIGKNSPSFLAAVKEMEIHFKQLTERSRRQTASGSHIALTFEFLAANVDEIIDLLRYTDGLPDLQVVL